MMSTGKYMLHYFCARGYAPPQCLDVLSFTRGIMGFSLLSGSLPHVCMSYGE